MKKTLYTIFILSILLLSTTASAQVTVPTDYSTINAAITAVTSGTTINVLAGTYAENVVVSKSVIIIGAGNTTVIQPSSGIGITVSANNVTLQDLKVSGQGGLTTSHDIWADNVSGLLITNVKTVFSASGSGIALRNVTGTSIITNVTSANNKKHGLEIGNGSNGVQVNGGDYWVNGTAGDPSTGGGIMIYADAGQTVTGTSIIGTVNALTNTTAGIYLFCNPGGHINQTTIGDASGTVSLDDNGSTGVSYGTGGAAVLVFGPCDQTTIWANSTNTGVVNPTAGLVVLGTDASGSNSPTNTVAKNCTLTGYTPTSPAATMYATHGGTTVICTNDVDAKTNNMINGAATGYDVEDVLVHKVDNTQLGRFLAPGSTVFVTPNSGSVQRGIIAARPPFTVATSPYTTIQVKAGTYNEPATLNLSWTAATLSGDGASTIIHSSSDLGINITGSTATVCSLTVTGASKHGIWADAVTNLNIHDITVDNNGTANGASTIGSGIALRGITGISSITNVIATNNKNDGLEIGTGSNGVTVSGGTYSNNGVAGFRNTGGGIFIYANSGTTQNTTITGTLTASNNTTAGIYIFSTPGIVSGTSIGQTGGDVITLANNGSTDGTNHGGAGVIVFGAATSTAIGRATFTQGTESNGVGIAHVGTDGTGSNSPSGTTVSNCTFNYYTSAAPAITNDLPLTAGLGPLHSNNDVAATTNTFKFLVNAKVFLQGPYNTGTSLMNTGLLTPTLRIPLAQPYSGTPWSYSGTESVASIPASVVDWILLDLRTGTAGSTLLAQRATFLRNDGIVLETDGSVGVTFTANVATGYNTEHYIVVRHRNHLAVMSSAIAPYPTQFDFSTAMGQAYGTVTTELTKPMKDLTGSGPFAMFAGDVTSNGIIKLSGALNDKDPIYARIGGGLAGATTSGYYNEDTNMNGQVKLSGASNDADIIYANIGGGLAGATRPTRVP